MQRPITERVLLISGYLMFPVLISATNGSAVHSLVQPSNSVVLEEPDHGFDLIELVSGENSYPDWDSFYGNLKCEPR